MGARQKATDVSPVSCRACPRAEKDLRGRSHCSYANGARVKISVILFISSLMASDGVNPMAPHTITGDYRTRGEDEPPAVTRAVNSRTTRVSPRRPTCGAAMLTTTTTTTTTTALGNVQIGCQMHYRLVQSDGYDFSALKYDKKCN